MLSLRHGRVARRLLVLTGLTRQQVVQRQHVRDNAAALAAIRAALAATGIDPETNSGVRYYRGAEDGLARLGDTPALQEADADFIAQDPQLAQRRSRADEAATRMQHFIGRGPPEPGAAPFDWYAWALAMQQAGAPRQMADDG